MGLILFTLFSDSNFSTEILCYLESAPPRIQATFRMPALLGLILTFTADEWKMHPSVLYLSQTLRKKL